MGSETHTMHTRLPMGVLLYSTYNNTVINSIHSTLSWDVYTDVLVIHCTYHCQCNVCTLYILVCQPTL